MPNSVHVKYGEQGALPSTVSWRSPFVRQRTINLQESCQDFEGRGELLLHNNDISNAAGSSAHGLPIKQCTSLKWVHTLT